MSSVFLCHAKQDQSAALELKQYLEAGTCYEIEASAIPEGETAATWYDHGGADAVVLLLSPRAVPAQSRLEEWLGVLALLEKDEIATVELVPCRKPQRLERRNHFDLAHGQRAEFRRLKQWLLGKWSPEVRTAGLPQPHMRFTSDAPSLEALRCAIADRAGRARVHGTGASVAAIDFAQRFAEDFERVIWTHCGDGTVAGAASGLAARLGLKLTGPVESDIEVIERHVAAHRFLLVLDSPPYMFLGESGRSSMLVTGEADGSFDYEHECEQAVDTGEVGAGSRLVLDALSRLPAGCTPQLAAELADVDPRAAAEACESLFRAGLVLKLAPDRYWSPKRCPEMLTVSDARAVMRRLIEERAAEDLANAEAALRILLRPPVSPECWEAAASLAFVAISDARDHSRNVEAHAMLSLLEPAARERSDMQRQESCMRERVWIEESWGASRVAEAAPDFTPFQPGLFDLE